MSRYAVVKGGIVVGVVEATADFVAAQTPGAYLGPLGDTSDVPVGAAVSDAKSLTFAAPAEDPEAMRARKLAEVDATTAALIAQGAQWPAGPVGIGDGSAIKLVGTAQAVALGAVVWPLGWITSDGVAFGIKDADEFTALFLTAFGTRKMIEEAGLQLVSALTAAAPSDVAKIEDTRT